MKKKKIAPQNNPTAVIDKALLYISFFPILWIVFVMMMLVFTFLHIPDEHFINITLVGATIAFLIYFCLLKRYLHYLNS